MAAQTKIKKTLGALSCSPLVPPGLLTLVPLKPRNLKTQKDKYEQSLNAKKKTIPKAQGPSPQDVENLNIPKHKIYKPVAGSGDTKLAPN